MRKSSHRPDKKKECRFAPRHKRCCDSVVVGCCGCWLLVVVGCLLLVVVVGSVLQENSFYLHRDGAKRDELKSRCRPQ